MLRFAQFDFGRESRTLPDRTEEWALGSTLVLFALLSCGGTYKIMQSSKPDCSAAVRNFAWLLSASVLLLGLTADPVRAENPRFIDLSLLVAAEYPGVWPAGLPPFQLGHYLQIGPRSTYNSDILTMDPHTGTQIDTPAHSVPRPESGLPNAAPVGLANIDKIPAWQFAGEACVIDVRGLRDAGELGRSALVERKHVTAWESSNRPLRFGDVVLFHSGYSDEYYKPLPEGRRFLSDPVEGKTPAWPDPTPEAMDYIGGLGVMSAGTDSPSMGPFPDLAEPTHLAGLKHGMIWTESGTGFGKLPTTGAFYCMLGPKHTGSFGTEARAFAIVGDPLAGKLIESVRRKQAIDLTVPLSTVLPVWWPGRGVGNHRQPYLSAPIDYNMVLGVRNVTHIMDSHSGTHLVPPAYALPREGFENQKYAPEVQGWLRAYEEEFGPRGTSDITTEKVPISQTCGWTRAIDVKHLAGTTDPTSWPSSPEITPDHIKNYESVHGELKAGEIVIFHSGYSDVRCAQPQAISSSCMVDPLNGHTEGWPAPGPQAIMYLADKGIRAVGTDGPTLGGAAPRRALMTYWALGTRGMVAVEYLTNVGALPRKAYFLFAAPKIRGSHGGPGSAIALF